MGRLVRFVLDSLSANQQLTQTMLAPIVPRARITRDLLRVATPGSAIKVECQSGRCSSCRRKIKVAHISLVQPGQGARCGDCCNVCNRPSKAAARA